MPSSKDTIVKEGRVVEALPGTMFRVMLNDGQEAIAHLSGKMRMNHIKVLVGDRVLVEFAPYDLNRGRLIRRL